MANDEKEDVLVPQQAEVEVYLNEKGDVVFKRDTEDWERDSGPAEDAMIIIPRAYISHLIKRLEQMREILGPELDDPAL